MIIKCLASKAIQQINSKDTPEGFLRSLKAEARRLHSTSDDRRKNHEDMISEVL
jgi:hypothetical protein